MKQVFATNTGMKAVEVPAPVPGPKEILVRVIFSLISSGTETSSLKKGEKSFEEKVREKKELANKVAQKISAEGLPATLRAIKARLSPSEEDIVLNPVGYSNAGVVVSKGSLVTAFNVADRVACAGAGSASHAEFVKIPINLAVKVPDGVPLDHAAFTTVGSIALQGLRRANVSFGETVVISGLGLLGLLAVQIAKAWGLRVIGLDVDSYRVNLARELGADLTLEASDPLVEEKVRQWTAGVGADAVVICAATKSNDPANLALRLCRKKGRVVVVGDVGMALERSSMFERELDFVMSTSYGPGRYDTEYELKGNDYPIGYVRWTENRNMQEFARLLSEEKVRVKPLISKVFPVEHATEAYDYLVDKTQGGIGVLFSYGETMSKGATKQLLHHVSVAEGRTGVGIIGAGGFVSAAHLPNLLALGQYYNLVAVSTSTPAHAKTVGKRFRAQYVTTDYHEILEDKSIAMVMIGTRHNLHAKMVVEALQAGKHVFVEKPLALNNTELEMVKDQVAKSKTRLTVGFNRRYSQYSIRAKEAIQRSGGPVFITYRVNAGHLPSSNWVQDPEVGGGRIIGECCHFLDLMSYLAGAQVTSIHAESIPVDSKAVTSEDNVATTVTYADGSLGVLTYISIGNIGLPKERIEIFGRGTSIVIDNFDRMKMFGISNKSRLPGGQDKGLRRELEEWAKCIRGEDSMILAPDEAYVTSEGTFEILRQLHG